MMLFSQLTDFQSLSALLHGIHRSIPAQSELSVDSCPAENAWAIIQTWRVETAGPLSENSTGNVTSQQMGAGVWRRGPITIPYIQIMLSILLTTQKYKGTSQEKLSLPIEPWAKHAALQSLGFLICKLGTVTSTSMGFVSPKG